jgi:hypothetical protein
VAVFFRWNSKQSRDLKVFLQSSHSAGVIPSDLQPSACFAPTLRLLLIQDEYNIENIIKLPVSIDDIYARKSNHVQNANHMASNTKD